MSILSVGSILVVAALHAWFGVLEMFLWRRLAPSTFGMSRELAESTATLAANQGLYNFFLAAGLVFALWFRGAPAFLPVVTFFLGCVVVAGVFGAATVSPRIALVQALPAAVALAFVWLNG